MGVQLTGIRIHDNVRSLWFSVYPEKQEASVGLDVNACSIVFGGKNTGASTITMRGEVFSGADHTYLDYNAAVKAGETHVFEATFTALKGVKTYTVAISTVGLTPGPLGPEPWERTAQQFTIAGLPSEVIPPASAYPPAQQGDINTNMPFLPTIPIIAASVINWAARGTFPDYKLFNLGAGDFGNMLGVVAKALGDTIAEPLKGLPDLVSVLGDLPNGLNTLLGSLATDLVSGLFSFGSDVMNLRIADSMRGTPDSVKTGKLPFTEGWQTLIERYQVAANPETYLTRDMTPATMHTALLKQQEDSHNLLRELNDINVMVSLASLGQVRMVADEIGMLEGMFGVSRNINTFFGIRQEIAAEKAIRKYYNAVWTPEIPNVQDLINMVVKEKMSLPDFKEYMLQQGFNENWSQLIWDAHFNAPDLNDILTAWRRGLIDEKRVDELMVLIDLDPKFKQVFDTRKYRDPSMQEARLMFETGAIPASEVPKYVHRLGFAPEFEAAMANFILHFQERRYRTRYITTLITALAQDKATEAEVRAEVAAIGFTSETGDLIVKTALMRKKTYVKADSAAKEAALTLSELKRAYLEDIVTEDFLRQEMMVRNYNLIDIQIVIDVLNKDKAVETSGRRVVALTVAEMVNAWRYGVVEEEVLRTNLFSRGLDLNEINILIETKKKQWGMGNIENEAG